MVSTPNSTNRVIIKCTNCTGKLRVPVGKVGSIQCPHCHTEFDADTRSTENSCVSNESQVYDVILGGQSKTTNSVVLGGIEGVEHRLISTNIETRISALSEALKYGQKGLELAIKAKKEAQRIEAAAHNILLQSIQTNNNNQFLEEDRFEQIFKQINNILGESNSINISLSKDRKIVAKHTSFENKIDVYTVSTGDLLSSIITSCDYIDYFALNLDGTYLVISDMSQTIEVWSTFTNELLYSIEQENYIAHLCLCPNTKNIIIVYPHDYEDSISVNFYSVDSGELVKTFIIEGEYAEEINFDQNGRTIVTCTEGHEDSQAHLNLWSVFTGKPIKQITVDYNEYLRPSYDKKLILCSDGYQVDLWSSVTLEKIYSFNTHNIIKNVDFSPDSKLVISSHEFQVDLWSIAERKIIHSLTTENIINSFQFNPNGQLLVLLFDAQVKVFSIASGEFLFCFDATSEILAIEFDSDNKFIAINSKYQINVYSLEIGTLLHHFQIEKVNNQYCAIQYVRFEYPNKLVAYADYKNSLGVWSLETGEALSSELKRY